MRYRIRRMVMAVAAIALMPLSVSAEDLVAAGRAAYQQTCIACHGANGKGALPGMSSFAAADGPLSQPDDVLLQSILEGKQSAGSPLTMPPRGGNPNLTEADARALVVFLRAEFGTP